MALIKTIKNCASADTFAWKYPDSKITTGSQLVVYESQEAIFVKSGQVCDVFQAGRHTLNTSNIPILSKIINLPFGGKSPFFAELWFVNKVFSLDIKWGTSTPIQLQDPKYKVFVPVRAFGQFGIQIEDSKKFLIKMVGTLSVFDKNSIIKYFRGMYLTKAKDAISSYLVHKNISVLEINAFLDEISSYLQEKMKSYFSDYGIKLVTFFVNDINIPENDIAVSQLKKALAKRAEMDIVGYNYQQERSFDTLEGVANNQNSTQSDLLGASIGLGMGVGVGNAFGKQFGVLSNSLNTNDTKQCPHCNGTINFNEKYCHLCGFDTLTKTQNNNKEIKCTNCGAIITENTKFCPECGNKYNPCSNCKADIPDGAKVCPICGTKVPKTCSKCGFLLSDNSKFCPECGHHVIKKCSACGEEIDDSTKFCPECGAKTI